MSERSWLVPSIILTVGMGAIALVLTPDYSGIVPALMLMPLWFVGCVVLGSSVGVFRMATTRVNSPVNHIRELVRNDRRKILLVTFGITIAGLNMIFFMWTKPLLNYFIPFWADPALARVDRILFFGRASAGDAGLTFAGVFRRVSLAVALRFEAGRPVKALAAQSFP